MEHTQKAHDVKLEVTVGLKNYWVVWMDDDSGECLEVMDVAASCHLLYHVYTDMEDNVDYDRTLKAKLWKVD